MDRYGRRLAVALALLSAVTLAACGGDGGGGTTAGGVATAPSTQAQTSTTPNGIENKTPAEIVTAARAAAIAASAVHVAGTSAAVEIDLNLVRGKGASGSIAQGGNRFELIAIGDTLYLRGSDDFYRSLGGDAVVRLLSGKWLQVPAIGQGFAGFRQFTDMDTLLRAALTPGSANLAKGAVTTVDGGQAVPIRSDARGTLYVATTGEPFPLEIVSSGDRGKVVFDRWNEPVTLSAPSGAVSLEQLSRARTG